MTIAGMNYSGSVEEVRAQMDAEPDVGVKFMMLGAMMYALSNVRRDGMNQIDSDIGAISANLQNPFALLQSLAAAAANWGKTPADRAKEVESAAQFRKTLAEIQNYVNTAPKEILSDSDKASLKGQIDVIYGIIGKDGTATDEQTATALTKLWETPNSNKPAILDPKYVAYKAAFDQFIVVQNLFDKYPGIPQSFKDKFKEIFDYFKNLKDRQPTDYDVNEFGNMNKKVELLLRDIAGSSSGLQNIMTEADFNKLLGTATNLGNSYFSNARQEDWNKLRDISLGVNYSPNAPVDGTLPPVNPDLKRMEDSFAQAIASASAPAQSKGTLLTMKQKEDDTINQTMQNILSSIIKMCQAFNKAPAR